MTTKSIGGREYYLTLGLAFAERAQESELVLRNKKIYHQYWRTFSGNVQEDPLRFISACTATVGGMYQWCCADFVSGGLAGATGLADLYQQCTTVVRPSLECLLNAIDLMSYSIQVAKKDLQQEESAFADEIGETVKQVTAMNGEFAVLVNAELQAITEEQLKAKPELQTALTTKMRFNSALNCLNECQKIFSGIQKQDENCFKYLNNIQVLAEKNPAEIPFSDKMKAFILSIRQAHQDYEQGSGVLNFAKSELSKAIEALDKAYESEDQAIRLLTTGILREENTKKIRENFLSAKKSILAAQEKLNQLQTSRKTMLEKIEELSLKIEKTKQEASSKFNTSSYLIGAMTSAYLISKHSIWTPAVGLSSAYVWRNMSSPWEWMMRDFPTFYPHYLKSDVPQARA